MKLKGPVERLTCLQGWCRGFEVDFDMSRGTKYRYHCSVCSKNITRWSAEGEPISGIIQDSIWAKYSSDPIHAIRPPFINKDQ